MPPPPPRTPAPPPSRVLPLPSRVLIVRLGAIGDVANALAFANALRDGAPGVHIGWAVHELARPLVAGHESVDAVHTWRKGSGVAGWWRLARELRAERYGLAVDLQRLAKSGLLARASGAARRFGYDRERSKEAGWIWSNERLAPGNPQAHMLDQYMEFARALGLPSTPRRSLPREDAAEAAAAALVEDLGGAPILINLGASKPANRWPAECFGELARALTQRGPVALVGGPDDVEAGEAAAASAGREVRNLAGTTSLPELIALLRTSRLFIGCDTGPMHLAAALDVPLVALFGPADEVRTGPYGWDRPELVAAPAPLVVRTTPACAPCGLKRCPLPRRACMLDLTVEAVRAAAERQLGAAG